MENRNITWSIEKLFSIYIRLSVFISTAVKDFLSVNTHGLSHAAQVADRARHSIFRHPDNLLLSTERSLFHFSVCSGNASVCQGKQQADFSLYKWSDLPYNVHRKGGGNMDASFIHDKLEIKFLILYIAARVSEPIPMEGMQELTLCDSGIDYFSFSECLNDLVQTEHLTLSPEGLYAITPKGLRNSEICESSLPMSVRLLTDRNVAAYNQMLLRRAQVRSRVVPRENGTFTVELRFSDDVDQLMHLELMAATEELARDQIGRAHV